MFPNEPMNKLQTSIMLDQFVASGMNVPDIPPVNARFRKHAINPTLFGEKNEVGSLFDLHVCSVV
jgi:hypothetical protein